MTGQGGTLQSGTCKSTEGLVIKNALMNRALDSACGDPGIAVANVLFSVCNIVGIFTGGVTTAYSTLAGICCGEQDRESLRGLFRTAAGIAKEIDYYNNAGVNTLIMKV